MACGGGEGWLRWWEKEAAEQARRRSREELAMGALRGEARGEVEIGRRWVTGERNEVRGEVSREEGVGLRGTLAAQGETTEMGSNGLGVS